MKAGEFVARVKKLGKVRSVSARFEAKKGKGSHGRLYYGDRYTTVKDRKKDRGPGLLRSMLSDLGLSMRDLE
jgi:mRNA interferase HicA